MKSLIILAAMAGMLKMCSKTPQTSQKCAGSHPDILHSLEQRVAEDVASDDSLVVRQAEKFIAQMDIEFTAYNPDLGTCKKLVDLVKDAEIKVIGGNWCSDTRREVPRMCRVLCEAGLPATRFSYFKVDRQKKAVNADFAAEQKVGRVPEFFVYRNGKLLGSIIETPRVSLEKDILDLLK
jgi:hypothetical protein